MSLFTQAFDAGMKLAARTLVPQIQHLEKTVETLEQEAKHTQQEAERTQQEAEPARRELERELEHALSQISQLTVSHSQRSANSQNANSQNANSQIGRLILITQLTDDSEGRILVKETDTLGAAVAAGTVTAAVDQPAKAAVTVDPENPMAYVVTRLPLASGDPDTLDVAVTLTDSVSGFSETRTLRFEPGKAAAMTLDVSVEPIPAAGAATPATGMAAGTKITALPAVGDIRSLPSNPADPASPPADHVVTAVAPDGSTVTASPVSGGISVTVPASDVPPPAG